MLVLLEAQVSRRVTMPPPMAGSLIDCMGSLQCRVYFVRSNLRLFRPLLDLGFKALFAG